MPETVAVLGAGIMGTSTALLLARSGLKVTLFDREPSLLNGASRWNEGKIHLGFLYAADPTLRTAEEVLPGGLAFKALVEELIGTSINDATTTMDDLYLVHPESVVSVDAMRAYFRRVEARIGQGSGYLAQVNPVHELSRREVESAVAARVLGGFRVPERSVDTIWISDRLKDAVEAESRIRVALGTTVTGVSPIDNSWSGPWRVSGYPNPEDDFDVVVNALWEGRLSVDRSLGLSLEPGWTHRFRQSLFVESPNAIGVESAVLATGPFGDVKNYGNGRYYLSYYPTGLLAEGEDIEPPDVERPASSDFVTAVRRDLTPWFPRIKSVLDEATTVTVGGGWVFAQGRGSLADPSASIHRRDSFGIRREGTYFTVDTGKYSTAPWLARQLSRAIRSI